jgi:4-amino-4-deoxy-L-arabinose transferase-like glycosyltransferase
VPLDIDELRLSANVKHYFTTGELLHDTVEHYPGAVFWLLAAASFVSYVRGLAGGIALPPGMLPIEMFAYASRMANVWVAAATVAVTGLLGQRLSGSAAGLLAALIVAIVPLSVETTTLVRNDPGMVLAVVATVHASLVFYASTHRGWGGGRRPCGIAAESNTRAYS